MAPTAAVSTTSSSAYKGKPNKLAKKNETLDKLKLQLSRYTRSSDRRMVIRSLGACTYLRCIPLEPVSAGPASSKEWKALEDELSSNAVSINGFHMAGSTDVSAILRHLCHELCSAKKVNLSPTTLYNALVIRLSRQTSSADAYFALNALLGSQDLILQKPKLSVTVPTSDLTLYESGGQIHASLHVYHPYGLFRKTDVTSGKPWIALTAVVKERVNLSTGQSCREVSMEVLEQRT